MFILFQSGINFSRGKSVMCGKVGHTTGACDFSGKKNDFSINDSGGSRVYRLFPK